MKREIVIPQMGLMESATVVQWLKATGEPVTKGDALVVIETDKATVDVEAPATGRLEIAVPASSEPVAAESVLGYVHEGDDPA